MGYGLNCGGWIKAMPIYEYCCDDCEQIFEEWQRNHDEVPAKCPVCGGEAKRIMSNTSFVLKGTGWYVTDYANGRSASQNSSGGNGNGEAKTDAAPAKDSGTPPASGGEKAAKADSSTAQS